VVGDLFHPFHQGIEVSCRWLGLALHRNGDLEAETVKVAKKINPFPERIHNSTIAVRSAMTDDQTH
jgi:hypothetical protein